MTAVLVPLGGASPDRMAAWLHLLPRWPWPVTIGVSDPAHWCKAEAVAEAVADTTADVLVVGDADVWCDGTPEAVAAVAAGAPWAIPHGQVRRLTREATADVLAGAPFSTDLPLDQAPYRGHAGGGIVVIRRDVYLDCPLDPRFVGWGQEDDSWALALTCLHGAPWRGPEPLWHLWHAPQARRSRRVGSAASEALWRRYRAARRNPEAMRSLLDESREVVAA